MLIAIWLGLFAMLLIYCGPIISSTQALLSSQAETQLGEHGSHGQVVAVITAEPLLAEEGLSSHHAHAVMDEAHIAHADAEAAVDYHALMGHKPASSALPQWLVDLEMCGYCELLTVSPALLLVLIFVFLGLPVAQWFVLLPVLPPVLAATYRLAYPRAPPIYLFV